MRLGLHDPLYDSRKEEREMEREGWKEGRKEGKKRERKSKTLSNSRHRLHAKLFHLHCLVSLCFPDSRSVLDHHEMLFLFLKPEMLSKCAPSTLVKK